MNNQPLVSIIVITYNQERWIRDTLDGVFSQTYPNIEWIISDDCSTDRTFEVIQDYILTHDIPRERVILNRNERNLRIAANYNKCLYDLAHGDLMVINEGDDISFPDRVERLVKIYQEHEPNLISSLYAFAVDDNRYCREEAKHPVPYKRWTAADYRWHKEIMYSGPTLCISRKLINAFPRLSDKTPWMDSPITRRAMLFGGGGGTSQPCNRQFTTVSVQRMYQLTTKHTALSA